MYDVLYGVGIRKGVYIYLHLLLLAPLGAGPLHGLDLLKKPEKRV